MKFYKILFILILLCNFSSVYAKEAVMSDDYILDYVNISWWKNYKDEKMIKLMIGV